MDWASRGQAMIAGAEQSAPMVGQALGWLAGRVPQALRVLDIGSGPGVAACAMAELLPSAEVIAVDGTPELLALAEVRIAARGLTGRVRTRRATLPAGLVELPAADLIWVSGVAHHLPDPADAVREMAALVRPGGVLALREGGLPLRCLPDHADGGLLARIDAVQAELSHHHHHPMGAIDAPRDWPALLREAGLSGISSRTFLLDLPAPLSPAARQALRHDLEMSRELLAEHLRADDLTLLGKLTSDTGPDSVLHRDDAFVLRASTIHTGTQGAA